MENLKINKKQKVEVRRFLLLTSYCHDNSKCSNEKPCLDCLSMCNTFLVSNDSIRTENYAGTLGLIK